MEEELKQNTQQPKDGQSASPKHMSIRSILGGDILANDFFKRQGLLASCRSPRMPAPSTAAAADEPLSVELADAVIWSEGNWR